MNKTKNLWFLISVIDFNSAVNFENESETDVASLVMSIVGHRLFKIYSYHIELKCIPSAGPFLFYELSVTDMHLHGF